MMTQILVTCSLIHRDVTPAKCISTAHYHVANYNARGSYLKPLIAVEIHFAAFPWSGIDYRIPHIGIKNLENSSIIYCMQL